MDINPIDIKIKEFASYLKDFGLLNETNINDFLKKFKNISQNNIISSGIYETDVNVGLIYLKENLSKAMLEFYNLMTEERKKIIYLNIYSKFIQKREEDLKNKGKKIYNLYSSLPLKKYFLNWKKGNINKMNDESDGGTNKNIIKNKFRIWNVMSDFKKDNFCFDIISDNEPNNKNVVINSNNHKIIFSSNNSTKFNTNNSNYTNNNSLMNSSPNINSLLSTTKSNKSEKILYSNFQTPKNIDSGHKPIYYKPVINQENILDRLFYPNKNTNKEYYQILNNIDISKNTNKSQHYMRNSVGHKNVINNMKQNSNEKRNTTNFKKKEELITSQKQRNTYTSSMRPKSYFNSNENKRMSVYQRLYEQNLEKRKRQEERIKENINEIKERANHPIQKIESQNNLKNVKKNKNFSTQNNNKLKISCEMNKENLNVFDKNSVSKKIDKVLFNKSAKNRKTNINENRKNNINDQKRKDGQQFIESQRKCIELFNNMIENEEKEGKKNFNESEKEKMFKDLLSKLYNENKLEKIKKDIIINEDEKIDIPNNNYNKICDSIEIKFK